VGVCVNVGNVQRRKERHMKFYVTTLNWQKSRGGENPL